MYGYRLSKLRSYQRQDYLNLLKERESWTVNEYRAWQKEAVREMLLYAATKVPYYRNWWKDRKQQNIADINQWPILEKETVRANPELFVSDDYPIKDLKVMHTSGTSGKPMTIFLSKESIGLWYALYDERIKRANGVDPETDIYGTFAGQLICHRDQKKPPFWVHNQYNNQVYFSSYHLSPDSIQYYVQALFKYRLSYLMGYTSSIHNLVKLAAALNLELPPLKLVITNAEPLYDHQRQDISQAFQCPVVQTYSGCEYAFGGSEAPPKQLMWLWPESGLLEVLTKAGDIQSSGSGEFLATGLVNKAMPLIRYRIGDSGEIATMKEIPAGGNKLFLKQIEGRTDDLIKTPDGKLIGRLDPVFKADFHILEAQIIQEKIDELKLLVVESEGFTNAQKQELVQRLKDRVGPFMHISYQSVKQISRGANGKFKAVISKIASDK